MEYRRRTKGKIVSFKIKVTQGPSGPLSECYGVREIDYLHIFKTNHTGNEPRDAPASLNGGFGSAVQTMQIICI
jgi:hypothetical protein